MNLINIPIKPVCSYLNAHLQRKEIFIENRNKSGIYLWTNNISGKCYAGSSINLSRRIRDYFNKSYLEREIHKSNSCIYKALLKYNYSNFRLDILEYCNKDSILKREQFYLDNLKLEYNVLKVAGSLFGFKHSDLSRERIRLSKLGSVCSEVTKRKLSANAQSCPLIIKNKYSEEILLLPSIHQAACFLNLHPSYISKCLNKKFYFENKTYHVTRVNNKEF